MLNSQGQFLFPALYLYPLNGSFAAKFICLRDNRHVEVGRQVDAKTVASRFNGYFDANVLSKQHAEIWEANGKIFIRDLESTQGTYVNGKSIGSDDIEQESAPHELNTDDIVEFGRDILGNNPPTVVHHKVSGRALCILSADDPLVAASAGRFNAGTFNDSPGDSILGKRQPRDIGEQATAFKRAKLLQTGKHPVCDGSVDMQCINSFPYVSDRVPSVSTTFSMDLDDEVENDISESRLREEASAGAPDEFSLLGDGNLGSEGQHEDHELKTAPLITRGAYIAAGFDDQSTQYGVLGRCLSIHSKTGREVPDDPRLYVNTNTPFSAIICGLQGSGKSHTMSVLLENMFIANHSPVGSLEKPLSGLVLHFGQGGTSSRPSEAAWVGVSELDGITPPLVRVYVSHSSLNTMKTVYSPLGDNVTVKPLFFDEAELDAESFLSMMGVGSSDSAPLYVHIILSILRDLGENFTLSAFQKILDDRKRSFNPNQLTGLDQRMSLLNAFMNSDKSAKCSTDPRFSASQLTIIDLSDPFIDSASACGLFEIIIRLFVRAEVGTGKVLVVDEAHKYLSTSRGSSGLTKSLLTLTREQRHLAMRVLISTQEPTVIPPVLLDLCTVAILHRFSSPHWWDSLVSHVSADFSAEDAFDKVVKLQTGEAIVLAPSGFGVFKEEIRLKSGKVAFRKSLGQFGRCYLLMKTRKRITSDGGASILVLP